MYYKIRIILGFAFKFFLANFRIRKKSFTFRDVTIKMEFMILVFFFKLHFMFFYFLAWNFFFNFIFARKFAANDFVLKIV